MSNSATEHGMQTSGAVRIRLHDAADQARRDGASGDEIFEEITIKLSRGSQPKKRQPAKSPAKPKDPSLSTQRILAQLSLLVVAIFIGLQFGGLMCLAFILFVCLPITTLHWTVADPKDRTHLR